LERAKARAVLRLPRLSPGNCRTKPAKEPRRCMKLIALSLASVFSLTGCSSLLGEESDAAACEKLATVVSTENVSLDTFSPTEVAAKLRSEVSPIAAGTLATRVDDLATALEGAEVDVAGAGAAASEIGVRCALSGVNFDFSVIGNLIN